MIRFILLQNRSGKTRLSKWYAAYEEEEREKIKQEIHRMITTRESRYTNFVEYVLTFMRPKNCEDTKSTILQSLKQYCLSFATPN